MSYTVLLKRSAEKELEDLSETIHGKIIAKLLTLGNNPRPRNVKKLRGRNGYRIRVEITGFYIRLMRVRKDGECVK